MTQQEFTSMDDLPMHELDMGKYPFTWLICDDQMIHQTKMATRQDAHLQFMDNRHKFVKLAIVIALVDSNKEQVNDIIIDVVSYKGSPFISTVSIESVVTLTEDDVVRIMNAIGSRLIERFENIYASKTIGTESIIVNAIIYDWDDVTKYVCPVSHKTKHHHE